MNREFCTACHAPSFHYGRPCDPIRKAQADMFKEQDRLKREAGELEAVRLAGKLREQGYSVLTDRDRPYILEVTCFKVKKASGKVPPTKISETSLTNSWGHKRNGRTKMSLRPKSK